MILRKKLCILKGPNQGAETIVEFGRLTIGSGADCDIILSDERVNGIHAEIASEESRLAISGVDSSILYVDGHQVSASPLNDFLVVTLGNTYLAVGPEAAEWPEISLPELSSRPGPNASSAADSAALQTNTRQRRKKSRFELTVAIVTTILLVTGAIVIFSATRFANSGDHSSVAVTASDFEKRLSELDFANTVRVESTENGFRAHGHVMTKSDKQKVIALVQQLDEQTDVSDIHSTERIVDNADKILHYRKLPTLTVSMISPGEIQIVGKTDSPDEWQKAKRDIEEHTSLSLLHDKVLEATPPKRTVETPRKVEPLKKREKIEPKKDIAPPESTSQFRLAIKDVTIGRTRFITMVDGTQVFAGSKIKGDLLVKEICSDYVILQNRGTEFKYGYEPK